MHRRIAADSLFWNRRIRSGWSIVLNATARVVPSIGHRVDVNRNHEARRKSFQKPIAGAAVEPESNLAPENGMWKLRCILMLACIAEAGPAPPERPIIATTETLLSGEDWKLGSYAMGEGERRGAFLAAFNDQEFRTVKVPGEVQLQVGLRGMDLYYQSKSLTLINQKKWWYRKRFVVDSREAGRLARLMFDGADYFVTVWLNGHSAREEPLFESLKDLPVADVELSNAAQEGTAGDHLRFSVRVVNGGRFARLVRLRADWSDHPANAPYLTTFSDNYFDLRSGEAKPIDVAIYVASGAIGTISGTLTVEGANAPARELPVRLSLVRNKNSVH